MRGRSAAPIAGLAIVGLILGVCTLLGTPRAAGATTWTQVGSDITHGISGIAAADSGWVIVRDNKEAGQNRVALLSSGNDITELAWPQASAPKDFEAIDTVPGVAGRYVAVTSGGGGRLFTIEGTTIRNVKNFTLPVGKVENEAFSLTTVGGRVVAVWGNRGSQTAPGRLYAATFNVSTAAFGAVHSVPITVPYPTRSKRHITDSEVLGNRIVISSAQDSGNDGPFNSALYDIGTVELRGGQARLNTTSPSSLGTFSGHKIEGIACKAGTGILGTDDENVGGFITDASFC